jgi:aspartate aminotransferase
MPWAGPVNSTIRATLTPPINAASPARAGNPSRPPAPLAARVQVSATLAANDELASRRRNGKPVLPLAFGEAGLPVPAVLAEELAIAACRGGYGPVAGTAELREAAAGYWTRRGLPTAAESVVAGPGSKALLFALLLAIDSDVVVARPSWVSYAAQARLTSHQPVFVPAVCGEGGVCDPAELHRAVLHSKAAGRQLRAVVVTLPDNPTGRLASPATVRALCEVAERHDLIIISDEIYRDLVHDEDSPLLSPALVAPDRTVVTTALSKSLAVGGWRLGVARMPAGQLGSALRDRLLGIGSEIWSAPVAPVQAAAAVAFAEPPEIRRRVAQSRALHATVAAAVAATCTGAGLTVPSPQAAFYVYPDFAPWRAALAARGLLSGADLCRHLLDKYGLGALPASAFGEDDGMLRLRLATGLLYGETDQQRSAALFAPDPLGLPWIGSALDRLAEVLANLLP